MGVINVAARAEPGKISEQMLYNNIDRDNWQGDLIENFRRRRWGLS